MITLAGRGRTLYPIPPTFSITLELGCPGDRSREQAFGEEEKKIQKEIRCWPWHRKALRRLERVTIWSYKSGATQATKLPLYIWPVTHQLFTEHLL